LLSGAAMRTVLVICFVLWSSCRPVPVQDVALFLESAEALDFGPVTVGATRTRSVAVEGRGPFNASTEAPFFVTEATLTAPVRLEVSFAPTEPGDFSGEVVLEGVRVRVSGRGVAALPCDTGDACATSRWDVDAARCVVEVREDGAACTQGCVTNGRCASGQCVGDFASCDDADACTVDACEASQGCVHVPVVCASSDPCRAARCDPASGGCVTTEVEDGVACGARDCSTAHVCLGGSCVERAVPNGERCGVASVCRAEGVCVDGACRQPAASSLHLAWRRDLSMGLVDFPAVTDDAGNLFWFECGGAPTCRLVSMTSSGVLRYEVATGFTTLAGRYRVPTSTLRTGELLIFGAEGVLEARRHLDGTLVWRTQLPARSMGNVSEVRGVTGLAAQAPDALYVAAAFYPGWMGTEYEPAFSRLNLRTGALEWDQRAGPTPLNGASVLPPSVVVDASGQPVTAGEYVHGNGVIRGLTPQGAVRWSTTWGPIALTSVIGDRVFHSSSGWFDAQGVQHAAPRFQNIAYPTALATTRGVVMLGVQSPKLQLMNERTNWQKVELLDFVYWPPRATPPALSSEGNVSFAQHGQRGPMRYEFSAEGAPVSACPFVLTSSEGVDMQQPVAELPGLMVLVDTGRQTVFAYRR